MTTEQRLAILQTELADMLDPLDLPGDWTARRRLDYEHERRALQRRIFTIKNTVETLTTLPSIDADREWLAFLTLARETLCNEVKALPSRVYTNADRGLRQNLEWSIKCIDRGAGIVTGTGFSLETLRLGQLMKHAGYVAAPPIEGQIFGKLPWFGGTDEVKQRIAAFERLSADAQARLADALLDNAARAAKEAAAQAERDRLNALPQEFTRGDGSKFLRWPDGRIEEVEVEMKQEVEG